MFGNVGRLSSRFLRCHTAFALLALGYLVTAQAQPVSQSEGRDRHVSGRVQGHLDRALECGNKNDFDCARAALNNIPRRSLSDHEQFRYWVLLAWVESLDGNFPAAIEAFRSAAVLSDSPAGRRDFLRYVAQLHASMGQFQQAYDTLEELLVLDGLVPLAQRHLTSDALWRGVEIYATGDRDLVPAGTDLPEFPAEAARQGFLHGHVDLEFTVTRNGSTRDVKVIESSALAFEQSAIEAVERFRYKPRLVDGKPVEVVMQHRIEFQSEESD